LKPDRKASLDLASPVLEVRLPAFQRTKPASIDSALWLVYREPRFDQALVENARKWVVFPGIRRSLVGRQVEQTTIDTLIAGRIVTSAAYRYTPDKNSACFFA
jgi:hypothetical protein